MPTKTTPLTFEVDLDLIEQLQAFKASSGSASVSVIVRKALEDFDFETLRRPEATTRQVSVRLPTDLRDQLKQVAKDKDIPIGQIVREALLALLHDDALPRERPIVKSSMQ